MSPAAPFIASSPPTGARASRAVGARPRGLLAALWFGLLPALAAAAAVRTLVPPVLARDGGVFDDALRGAQGHALPLGVGLFFLFAACARYWRWALPGGRYLSVLPARPASQRFEWASLAVGLAVVAGATWLVRARLVESYSVLSGSMLPTLAPGDWIVGQRLAYRTLGGVPTGRSPRRGDVIVFKSRDVDGGNLTDTPDDFVKRVIGVPGDRIGMRGGIPVINGWTVPVCDAGEYLYVNPGGDNGLSGRLLVEYVDGQAYLTVHAAAAAPFTETYEVQPGEVFVLGDNRNNSSDSRAWNDHHGGGVPFSAIEARVVWFVAGKRADRTWDMGRFFRSIPALATRIRLDGVHVAVLQAGIDACLRKWPSTTTPPQPGEAPAKPAAPRPETP